MAPKVTKKKSRNRRPPRNIMLGKSGIMLHSRSKMFHKRGQWVRRKTKKVDDKKKKPKKPDTLKMVVKQIGGDNNGKTRVVPVARMPRSYVTEEARRKLKSRKKSFSEHKRKLRPTIKPGTILILVSSRHKGKRVVFLKQLKSGLLLVTGPFKYNGVPLRRIHQNYVIATKTQLNLSKLTLPKRLNDTYFKRVVLNKSRMGEGEIFDEEKEEYTVSDRRKKDQTIVDQHIISVIKKHADSKYLQGYLKTLFSLQNGQHPHNIIF